MEAPSFDPKHAVRFDLPGGAIHTGADGERVLLVPTGAMEDLVLSAPPEAVEALGRALGSAIGKRVASRLGEVADASIEAFVTHLAGEAAVAGVGAMSLERWGRAVVVVVEGSPLTSTVLAPLVGAAIEASSRRGVACTILARDERFARIFVGGERGVGRVREWIASGLPWGEALAKLQGAAS